MILVITPTTGRTQSYTIQTTQGQLIKGFDRKAIRFASEADAELVARARLRWDGPMAVLGGPRPPTVVGLCRL